MKGGAGLRLYALVYLLFLYAPILLLPVFAFNSGTIIAFPLKGFTTSGSPRCSRTHRCAMLCSTR